MLYFRRRSPKKMPDLDALVKELKPEIPKLSKIELSYGYIVITNTDLSHQQKRWLKKLLPDIDKEGLKYKVGNYSYDFWLVPRFGSTTSMTTAARELCLLTGLPAVLQIIECRQVKVKTRRKRGLKPEDVKTVALKLIDPLQESVVYSEEALKILEQREAPRPTNIIDIQKHGVSALHYANDMYGLSLSNDDCDYLFAAYDKVKRNPTDIEIIMYARLNTEPAHHNYFNSQWTIANNDRMNTVFEMIKATNAPGHTQQYFYEHGAILQAYSSQSLMVQPSDRHYQIKDIQEHLVLKTETQHEVALVCPEMGAGAASGQAMRDEIACGRGANPQMHFVGLSVSDLYIPDFQQAWEQASNYPPNYPNAYKILVDASIGAAKFCNQVGKPILGGYVRTLELEQQTQLGTVTRGYHKPIVFNAGVGAIAEAEMTKRQLNESCLIVVLGGPAYAVGIIHPECISEDEQQKIAALDYSQVQRLQPDLQLRSAEVIKQCAAMGDDNPIMSLWDVGDGGLAVAVPELLQANKMGAQLELRKLSIQDTHMSPMEIWACEASERMVIAIERDRVDELITIANRERCPYAILGQLTKQTDLNISDNYFHDQPVATPMNILFDHIRQDRIWAEYAMPQQPAFDYENIDIAEAAIRVLHAPAVADKSYLMSLYDRSVGGLTVRDQMIGPWQIPVSDVAIIANDYTGFSGKAYAVGERPAIALAHPAAAARMALGEAITNLAAAPIAKLSDVSIAINWQLARGFTGEDAGLYQSVAAICQEVCPILGISIVAGDEEIDLRAVWKNGDEQDEQTVTAPQTAIVSAVAPVSDIRKIISPQLRTDVGETKLILIDLGKKNAALAGSVLAQVYDQIGARPPDLDDPILLKYFFEAIQYLDDQEKILAYHDRSDGGLFVTLCEMAFASQVGITCHLDGLHHSPIASLFNEELGAVVQVRAEQATEVLALIERYNLGACCTVMGEINHTETIEIVTQDEVIYSASVAELQQAWSETSYKIRADRDNPETAKQAYELIGDKKHQGLTPKLTYDCDARLDEPYLKAGQSPKIAVLREQGCVGYNELAAAFKAAHFDVVDLTMSDILEERVSLNEVMGLAISGGYSFADSLGPGYGWAQTILLHQKIKDQFAEFFHRNETFTFGVGNGAQLLLQLKDLIPGTKYWPTAHKNRSHQFESHLIQVQIAESNSLFFKGMEGSVIPVPVACEFGRLEFRKKYFHKADQKNNIVMQYVDSQHQVSDIYSYNPVGSEMAAAGFCNHDGRVTGLMVHPERVFCKEQMSWYDKKWLINSPWLKVFNNIRQWVN